MLEVAAGVYGPLEQVRVGMVGSCRPGTVSPSPILVPTDTGEV
jgi:hypothetical protein